ncbi:MAG: LysM peptidoglycan-binding domain-containing protein [Acidobacteriota bacterium]
MVRAVGNNDTQSLNNGGNNTYTVKSGDTLSEIAQRNGVSLSSLIAANPQIKNPSLIFPGQQINVPASGAKTGNLSGLPVARATAPSESPSGGKYTVKSGDTLSGIAERKGISLSSLMKANPQIKNPSMIFVGQQINLPGGSGNGNGSKPTTKPTNGTGGVGPVGPTPPTNTKGGITLSQLQRIMPNLPASKAQKYLPYLNQAMAEANINTPARQAAFLAQLAHESGELKYFEELASGAAYEGRRDLGNVNPGDGVRYKGRGPIQLTGRNNYRAAGRALGIDLENNPTRADDPDVGFRTAAWFWSSRNLNKYADAKNFDAITYRVNGGYNGKASRDMYYQRALNALGA